MGNQQHSDISAHHIELDRSEGIYLPNDIVSGNIFYLKRRKAYILLTGIVYYEKHTKKHLENCQITFFSTQCPLISSSPTKQTFQLRLDENLPPSFNNPTIFPRISYSINLVEGRSKDRIHFSLPIRVCPIIQIDQPLLLTPLHFGPIDNLVYGTKLEVKVNRSAFTFNEPIEIYYELQNPNEEYIDTVDVSLGVYYLVESNIWQQDVCHSKDETKHFSSKQKLIRNKVLLNIPYQMYLPPTFNYKHDRGDEQSSFKLTIDYKIQLRIYLSNPENLWQVDIPIVLCNKILEHEKIETTDKNHLSKTFISK